MTAEKIASHIDHTLLKAFCSWKEIQALCDEAVKYNTASVCIPPSYVKECADYCGDKLSICTVIGFPNGYNTTVCKVFEAADAVNQTGQNDAQVIEGLQAGITFWMEEMKSLYQQWAALRPEYAQQITAHQEAFMDYYRAQLGIWNAHFGSPSMAALEKAMEMLAEHCSELCMILSGTI